MQLVREDGKFFAITTFAEKDIPRAAKFRWDGAVKRWWTDDVRKAALLAEYADADLKAELSELAVVVVRQASEKKDREQRTLEASRSIDAAIDIPVPAGLSYLPYQRGGIAFATQVWRDGVHKGALIGDDMGLGKTIQALGAINMDETIRKILIICPASLKLNWQREAEKWLVREYAIGIAVGDDLPNTDIVIINPDLLERHHASLLAVEWDLTIIDEAHLFRNPRAKRTLCLRGGTAKDKETGKSVVYEPIHNKRRLELTGTPIGNRPKELFPMINDLAPDVFPKFFPFALRYCDGKQDRFGWNFDGSSHLEELQHKLRSSCMIRRLKSEVLKELPAKRRQVIELPANGAAAAIANEQTVTKANEERLAELRALVELAKALDNDAAYDQAVASLKEAVQIAFTSMALVRKETAVAKVPYVIEHVADAIENSGKVILFCHHKEVAKKIATKFGKSCVTVTGDTKMADRQAAVDRFQTDPDCTLFLGNIAAAGVGLTLTASSHVVFAELSWVPGDVTQAEDRSHRIGQCNSVLIQHLVLEGSIDAKMARAIVAKQEIIDRALDDAYTLPENVEPDLIAEIEAAKLRAAEAKEYEQANAARRAALDAQWAAERAVREADKRQREEERQAGLIERAATQERRRDQIAAEAQTITKSQIAAVHAALRMLAGMDTDRAMSRNDIGYNKVDGTIGHALANEIQLTPKQAALGRALASRYWRQIGLGAVEAMGAPIPKAAQVKVKKSA